MPNYCWYSMKAVSKSREALVRLIEIMHYRDPEYSLYRVLDCDSSDIIEKEIEGAAKLYSLQLTGNVAWSAHNWFDDSPGPKEPGKAQYVTFRELCPALGIAVECYGEECGNGFQEWHACNPDGEHYIDQCVNWRDMTIDSVEGLDELVEDLRGDVEMDKETYDEIKTILDKYSDVYLDLGGLDYVCDLSETIWNGEVEELAEKEGLYIRE